MDHGLPDKSLYPHVPRVLGWLGGDLNDAGDYSRLADESTKSLQGFAENFATWLGQWSFDGAHIDWRYPGGPCDVANDYKAFVALLQLLRKKTRLLSVAIAYKDTMLAKRYDIDNIASLADMLILNTDEKMAEDNTGQPSCAGVSITQVAASLWRVRRIAVNSELKQRQHDGDSAKRRVQLCHTVSLASAVYYRSFAQPSNKTTGVIAAAGPDDLRRRLEQAYVVHDFGHDCVAAAELPFDDRMGQCGHGRWPLLRALY
ncbi:chitotriosidase-1-like isoform X3 [Rhipicephalus sanguineus]|uniref:chitotriosidase-1-like isoform X3 n=1 Tax=Rhipicephalus sanguineus TaxID=34632 RepID=UPI0020C28469|nr:chitotriosidase-1-like isoform X3 [Rhipicephalus sanguineus]